MTLTTQVRINHPVPAGRLLDVVTVAAGGDPATVGRWTEVGEVANEPAQGLETWARVRWAEQPDVGYEDYPMPPALVVLTLDNTWSWEPPSAEAVQAGILEVVADWLDGQGVPRSSWWWWEDECAGTFHPGTTDVRLLAELGEREVWTCDVSGFAPSNEVAKLEERAS